MGKYYVYIIHSTKNYYYIGQTQDLTERLKRHNSGRSKWTKGKGTWEFVVVKEFSSRSEAVQMEIKLKKMKSSKKAIEYLGNQLRV